MSTSPREETSELGATRAPAAGLPPAQDVVELAIAEATRSGEDCVVIVEDASEADVRFANNTTTTNGVRRDRRVSVVCFRQRPEGTAVGVAREGGAADVAALVKAAERDAADAGDATDAAPLVPGRAERGFGEPAELTGLEALGGVLDGLGPAFRRAAAEDRVLAGFAEHGIETTYLGTTTGLRRRHAQPTGALHLVARSGDGQRSSWAATGTDELPGRGAAIVEELEGEVARSLGWAARRLELDAGRYEVLLPPAAVADLMLALVDVASGREAEEGRTVFSAPTGPGGGTPGSGGSKRDDLHTAGGTMLGETLTDLPFSLSSDPGEPGLECAPFFVTAASSADVSVFDNGLPLGRTEWIDGGRLGRLRYHRAGAARAGVEPTPPIDNLILSLKGATASLEELVANTERGLLLTCLWYIRTVDPATLLLTGLTRDGVYLVEDGRVRGAVNNFRFNESPVDLLARTTEVGATTRTLGREFGEWENRTAMPPLRVRDFNMSTVSRAS